MIQTTRAQRVALKKVWERHLLDETGVVPLSYKKFRKAIYPGRDYILVQFAGMWLGIEKDGYTHS